METVDPAARTWFLALWTGAGSLVALVGATAVDGGAAQVFERTMIVVISCCVLAIARYVTPAYFGAAGIALTVFSGHWGTLGVPLPLDRVLLGVAILSALARYLGNPVPGTRIVRPVHGLLIAAAVLAVASAVWSGTLEDSATRFALLDNFGLVPFAMFIVAPLIFPGPRERAVLLGALVATGAYLGLVALFESIGADSLVWPRYILDPGVGVHVGRARGPFTEAVANGLALYVCGAAAVAAAVTWRRPIARAAASGVVLLCAAGLFLTLTRSIWLASAVATAIVMLTRRPLRRYVVPVALVAIVGVAASISVVPSLADKVQQRQADERSIWDRQNQNGAALRMVADRPLLGFGFGAAQTKRLDYVWQSADFPLTGANVGIHNAFLGLAVQLGMLGALLWAAAFIATVGSAACRRGPPGLEPWRLGLLAIAVQGLLVQNFVPGSYPFTILVTWLVAGCISGARADALDAAGAAASVRPSFAEAVHPSVA